MTRREDCPQCGPLRSCIGSGLISGLAPDHGSIVADPNVALAREWLWTFDAFDNWAGANHPALDPPGLGVVDDTDGDGTYDDGSLKITHEVTSGNEIETAWVNDGTLVTQPYVYDGAGNLIFDGELFYQYDGFNRLVQVNAGTDLDPNDFSASTGRLVDPNTAPVGVRLAAFIYDGLGRLIRTVRQDPNAAAEAEDYYYDGVRRIQEVVTDPGDPNTPLVTRNYVWGPGYVDEILARRDDVPGQPARLYFLLQDANYNTVALLAPGVPAGPPVVLAQWQYAPYGQVVAYEADANAPVTRLGFQGLFFERFYYRTGEALGANPGDPPSDPPLSDLARGLYHVRNRWLDPVHGRFTSRDPVDTALPILTALASNGEALAIVLGAFDAQGHFGDGMNLYAFGGANPFRSDALGLSWGYDDEIDQLIDDQVGHALYTLGTLNEGAKWAALGLQTSLSVAGALLGVDVFDSVYLLASGGGGFWDAMNIVASVNPIGRLGRVGGVVAKGFGWMQKGRKSGRIVGSALEHMFKILPYGKARKLTKNFNRRIQAHKLFEWRHVRHTAIKKGDIPAVILPEPMHTELTTILQRKLKTGRRHNPDEIWRTYQEVYTELGHPEWVDAIRKYFQ